MADLRMSAYYYSFEPTGLSQVDLILSAVACAGKAFHHTDYWNEECGPYEGHTGNNPVEWIQNAANVGAEQLRARIAQLNAQIDRLIADGRELRTENEALRADSERLDWLEDHSSEHSECDRLRCFDWHENYSVREALDAARGVTADEAGGE